MKKKRLSSTTLTYQRGLLAPALFGALVSLEISNMSITTAIFEIVFAG